MMFNGSHVGGGANSTPCMLHVIMDFSFSRFVILVFFLTASSAEKAPKESKAGSHLELYKRLFELKRKEQIETAQRVWKIDDYAHQYKTISYLMNALFPVLRDSLKKLTDQDFSPDHPFPEDQETQDELGKVYENVIFFGDFVLRMPDMTKKIYKQNEREWKPVLWRAVEFCRESSHVITGPHAKHLHLMSQELGLIPEEPDYVNPFRGHRSMEEFEDNQSVRKKGLGKDKKKEKTRGPKLRGSRHGKTEL